MSATPSETTIHELATTLGTVSVKIGLREQGHTEAVERMILVDGATWDIIGAAINWHGPTALEWYAREAAAEIRRLCGPICPFDQMRASEHTPSGCGTFSLCANHDAEVARRQGVQTHPRWPEGEAWLAEKRS